MDYKYDEVSTSVDGHPIPASTRAESWVYPGQRRAILPMDDMTDKISEQILVKTAGNALQAVSRSTIEQKNLLSVHVPRNTKPGDSIFVRTPSGSMVSAAIPEGCFHGHTFFVKVSDEQALAPVAVMGVPVGDNAKLSAGGNIADTNAKATEVVYGQDLDNHDLAFQHNQSSAAPITPPVQASVLPDGNPNNMANDPNIVLVQVPLGLNHGDLFQVQAPDGRLIEATVPPGNLKEFYLRVPTAN